VVQAEAASAAHAWQQSAVTGNSEAWGAGQATSVASPLPELHGVELPESIPVQRGHLCHVHERNSCLIRCTPSNPESILSVAGHGWCAFRRSRCELRLFAKVDARLNSEKGHHGALNPDKPIERISDGSVVPSQAAPSALHEVASLLVPRR